MRTRLEEILCPESVYLFMHVRSIFLALDTIPGSCSLRLWVPVLGSCPYMCYEAASPGVSEAVALQHWHTDGSSSTSTPSLFRARATLPILFLPPWIPTLILTLRLVTLYRWPSFPPDQDLKWASVPSVSQFLGSLCPLFLCFSSVLGEVGVGGQIFLSFHFFPCSWFFSPGWSRDDQ